MATAPTWQAPNSGQPPLAAHINQALGPHAGAVLYTGTQQAAQTTNGATSTSTNGLYLAQSLTTSAAQTTLGLIFIPLTTTATSGSLLPPTTIHLYANSGGAPSGNPIVSTTVTAEYANDASGGTATTRIGIPLPASGLTPSTTYWIVADAAGNGSNSFTWYRSNQTSGASTSTNGTTWTQQTYGFVYAVQDAIPINGMIKATWEDAGARWTYYVYDGNEQISKTFEYTAGQTAAGYMQSDRTLSYSGGLLTNST